MSMEESDSEGELNPRAIEQWHANMLNDVIDITVDESLTMQMWNEHMNSGR